MAQNEDKEKKNNNRIINGTNKRTIGTAYEEQAVLFLQQKGYYIVEKNFRCRQGEIDIVARDGQYLVFVEVKYRKASANGLPEEAVDRRKQQKIIRTAQYYLYQKNLGEDCPCRFDVVGICGDRIRLTQNAFEI